MSVVIPFNLSNLAQQVLRITSLYPLNPAFANFFDNTGYPVFPDVSDYTRDFAKISTGFPYSYDVPYSLIDADGVFSLPKNAYSTVLPSFLSGLSPDSGDTYSVILIDMTVAPLTAGLTNLKVDYIDNNGNLITEYIDTPFWPKKDVHPLEIEQIKDYAEGAIAFIQKELDLEEKDILQVLNRMLLRGEMVSGQVFSTVSSNTQPSNSVQSHYFIPDKNIEQKFILAKEIEKQISIEPVQTNTYAITAYNTIVYAGETISVSLNKNPIKGDAIYLNGMPLVSVLNGNILTAQLPAAANLNYKFNLNIANRGIVKSNTVLLNVSALPYVSQVIYENSGTMANPGEHIYILGNNLGAQQGTVVISGQNATINYWTNNSIDIFIPNNTISSFGSLTTADNKIAKFKVEITNSTAIGSLEIIPNIDLVGANQTINYIALLNGMQVFPNWTLEDNLGNIGKGTVIHGYIDSMGNYTAPSNIDFPFNLSVDANYTTSQAKYSAKAALTVGNVSNTLTISPSAVNIQPSNTTKFNVYDNGILINPTNVSFYINGILNGNIQYGTITRGGLYQAPATIPKNNTIHVQAVYQEESALATLKLTSGISTNSPHMMMKSESEQEKTTYNAMNLSYMRSVAYTACGVSNQYYGAPGVLSPAPNGYNEFFISDLFMQQEAGGTRGSLGYNGTLDFGGTENGSLTTHAETHGEVEYLDGLPMGFYIAEARDSANKRCVVAIFGLTSSPTAFPSAYNQQLPFGYGSLGLQLTINATTGSLSNNANIATTELSQYSYYGGKGWTVDSLGQSLTQQSSVNPNFTNGVIEPFNTRIPPLNEQGSGSAGYAISFDLPTGLQVTDQYMKFINNNVVNTPLVDNGYDAAGQTGPPNGGNGVGGSFSQLSQAPRVDAFYYCNQPIIGTMNSLLQYEDNTNQPYSNLLVSGNPFSNSFQFLPDVLWDMVPSGDGSYFARAVFYPTENCTGLQMLDLFNFWTTLVGGTNENTGSTTLVQSSFNLLKYLSGENSLNDAPNVQQTPAYLNFDSTPSTPPPPQVTGADSGCPNSAVNVYGKYFPANAQVYFVNTNQMLPANGAPSTIDGINYVISVTIPNNISQQAASYPIYVSGSTGTSNTNINLTIANDCVIYPLLITVSPNSAVVDVNQGQQYTATFQDIHGNTSDVTDSVTWYSGGQQNGNSTAGYINNSGFFFAPPVVPNSNPTGIMATYNYQGQPLIGNASAQIKALYQGPPPPAPPLVHNGCYMLRVSPETASLLVPGSPPQQFTAQFYIDDGTPQMVSATSWLVNNIPGGDSFYGTIDSTGLYTPPQYYPPSDFQNLKITANYTVTTPAGNSLPISGYAIVSLHQQTETTTTCNVVVSSQINVTFGDGRIGYVPAGSSINLSPGQYLLATYSEMLDTYFIPISNSTDQLLPLFLDGVQSNDLTSMLYNEGTLVKTSGNGFIEDRSNIFSQPYTVILGVCDPNNGTFQSYWDLVPVLQPQNDVIPAQPNNCIVSHNMEEKIAPTVLDEVKEKVITGKKLNIKKIIKNNTSMWFGEIELINSKLIIHKNIKLFQYQEKTKNMDMIFESQIKEIDIKPNQLLYFNGKDLLVSNIDKKITDSKNIMVLGVFLNKFYSSSQFINVINSEERTIIDIEENEISIMQFGNLIIQWGKLSSLQKQLNFKVPFKKSYNLNISKNINIINKELDKFNYISDSDTTWVAIGS